MNEDLPKGLKKALRELVINIPFVSDCFLHYWVFPRSSASCRGVFPSFAAAEKAIPTSTFSGYDQCYKQSKFYATSRDQNLENMAIINQINKPIDYPVLVWLREAFTDGSTVFDLGGNTGYGYYSYRKMIPYPATLKWTVCDLPEVVEAGKEILEVVDSPGLAYTTKLEDAEGSDIFITCGTLQYLEPSLAEILGNLKVKPRHLIIHHVPLYEGREYCTHQNLMPAYVPYKIQNHSQFLASLSEFGYEIIDDWEVTRTCRIPFHPERFVRAYYGFYLRRKS